MTQTITSITNNSDDNITVDIYYHPNNSQASVEDSQSRYRYTCIAARFTQDDLANWLKNTVDFENENDVEELKEIIDMFAKAAENDLDYIWRCSAENGHDDYLEFHALREDAKHSLITQTC